MRILPCIPSGGVKGREFGNLPASATVDFFEFSFPFKTSGQP
jgi:hypothetical protein